MKKTLLLLLLCALTSPLFSQDEEMKQLNKEIKNSTEKLKQDMEKFRVSQKHFDSVLKQRNDSMQSIVIKQSIEQNGRNLDAFMTLQKEREQQQTKQLWIRGGIFAAMLLLFIFGLARRKKLQKKDK